MTRVVTLFVSLLLHKGIEAFSVGVQIARGKPSPRRFLITVLIYSFMTPLGTLLGVSAQALDVSPVHKDAIIVVLECFAAGTIIYVIFLEVQAFTIAPFSDSR